MNTKQSIAVIGLRKGQDKLVSIRCGSMARIHFIDADRSGKTLPRTDHIILTTKFIRHAWMEVACAVLPRARVHLHDGGLTGLIGRIIAISNAV